jgi:CDP-diacylglycerol--glycerol-3-phosphate 3-phosphatidyltransferase
VYRVSNLGSVLEPTVALAVIAFIATVAWLSIAAAWRRPASGNVSGSAVLGPGIRGWYLGNLRPAEDWCVRHNISPSALSYAQLLGGALVGLCYASGMLFTGGWLLLSTGTLDIIDGRIARRTDSTSIRGAFLDSVIDRYVESFAYIGLAILFRSSWVLWAVLFALLGSLMVSYARARAEGLGARAEVGVFQRPERVVILGFGTIFGALFAHLSAPFLGVPSPALVIATIVGMALLANLTALQRVIHAWRELEQPSVRVAAPSPSLRPNEDAALAAISHGKGLRVLGTFTLMIGAGWILDAHWVWSGGVVLLAGAVLFAAGLLALRPPLAAAAGGEVGVSHPLGSNR